MSDNAVDIGEFRTLDEWVESGSGGSAFNRRDKVDWEIRKHKAELIASGEFIPGVGARPSLVGPGFGAVLTSILRRGGTLDI